MWLTDDGLRALSQGEIQKPDSYNYRTFLPEQRGLYCSSIFGPVDWNEGELRLSSDDRVEHWGHLELPKSVARLKGPSRRVILVLPPRYRRFRLLSAQEHQQQARARRAELVALAATEEWPYCDPLEKLLAEEGLTSTVEIEALQEGAVEPPLNCAYRAVINHSHMLRRLSELDAPADVLDETRALLEAASVRGDVEVENHDDLPNAVRSFTLGYKPQQTA